MFRFEITDWPVRVSINNLPQHIWSHVPMSHIVSIKTQVKDPLAIQAACRRLQLPEPQQRTARLFNSEATGLVVELRGWTYPLVCDTTTGELKYDNFEGRWGDESQLHLFLQSYAVERATLEARRQGHSVSEQQLADGSIRVQITVAG
jgi:hypothetical protein